MTQIDVECRKEIPQDEKLFHHVSYKFRYGNRVVKTTKECQKPTHLIQVTYYPNSRLSREAYVVYMNEAYSYDQVRAFITLVQEDIRKNASLL